MEMDVLKICRTCMKEVTSCESEIADKRILHKFTICTNIKITEGDKLPKQFCNKCVSRIETSYTFIRDAHKIDEILRNIYDSDNNANVGDCTNNLKIKEEPINVNNEINIETIEKQEDCKTVIKAEIEDDLIDNNIHEHDDDLENKSIKDEPHVSEELNNTKVRKPRKVKKIDKKTDKTKEKVKKKILKNNLNNAKNTIDKTDVLMCKECKQEFQVKSTYYRHMANKHSAHVFKCEHCPKTFATRYSLNSHAVCHVTERLYPCPTCGKRFKRRMQLRAHARAHSDSRPYECDICHMRFKFKSAVQGHIARVHEEKKEYLCTTCGMSFSRAANLEVHMRVHTGEKPYRCNECDHRSTTMTCLRRHQRRHTGVKPYVCPECEKSFYDKGTLDRHKRLHTGELPFKCPHCENAFNDSWKRKVHLARVHQYILTEIPKMRRDGQTIS